MMVFIIRSFGGEVCWDGEGSPVDPAHGGVTHHVCDRPMVGHCRFTPGSPQVDPRLTPGSPQVHPRFTPG